MKSQVNDLIAKVLSWSMAIAGKGMAPTAGFFEETLSGNRGKLGGRILAGGHRFTFVGSKGDCKARVMMHNLDRHYGCNLMCDRCLADRRNGAMSFRNFAPEAPHRHTLLSSTSALAT